MFSLIFKLIGLLEFEYSTAVKPIEAEKNELNKRRPYEPREREENKLEISAEIKQNDRIRFSVEIR